ncbi:MAG: hotdog fold thioesterase [Methanomassiliicoccus sp.]|nr:hotdog fold thioesterase [Methanomassiliicoccus sp.]
MKKDLPADLEARLGSMVVAPYALHLGMETVSIGENEAVVRMPVDGLTNALGTVHGGAIFSLADQAFALAANSRGEPQVALNASITYLRPGRGDLVATARKVEENKSTSVYEVQVVQGEEVIAIFQGIGYKLRRSEKK